jgi:hypothetical protein
MTHLWVGLKSADFRHFWHVANATAKARRAEHHPSHKLRMVLGGKTKEIAMTRSKSHKERFSSDRSFPYVLLCSTVGTVVSLASVWIATAQSVAQAMVA